MGRVIKIASAFIAVIIGAGFASGQEILLFFTSFGYMGTIGAVISAALFAYFGMIIVRVGSQLQARTHQTVMKEISGGFIGPVIDIVLIFTLFTAGVVMIAGSGTIVEQQFSVQPFIGSLLMAILVVITLMFKVDKIITVIGLVVPFLAVAIIAISIYSINTMEMSFAELNLIATSHQSVLPNWFVSSINYVSFNIAGGAGMALLIGGAEKDIRIASLGGFFGGIGIGILIVFGHLAIFSRVDVLLSADMPLLLLMNEVSDVFGRVMSFILLAMIYSTAVGMFYAFVARFFDFKQTRAILPIIVTVSVGFVASFLGFTKLVAWTYPLVGYLGIVLMLTLIYAPFKIRKIK